TLSTVHAHLSDKSSELYHILQRIRTSDRSRKATRRLREVLRALRGTEAHRRDARRVKVASANFIGN
ncbi:hypothetical protein WN51_02465, partial [Melipona quadrifasciata]